MERALRALARIRPQPEDVTPETTTVNSKGTGGDYSKAWVHTTTTAEGATPGTTTVIYKDTAENSNVRSEDRDPKLHLLHSGVQRNPDKASYSNSS